MRVSVLQPFELCMVKIAQTSDIGGSGYLFISRHFAWFKKFVVTGFKQHEKEKQSPDHKEL